MTSDIDGLSLWCQDDIFLMEILNKHLHPSTLATMNKVQLYLRINTLMVTGMIADCLLGTEATPIHNQVIIDTDGQMSLLLPILNAQYGLKKLAVHLDLTLLPEDAGNHHLSTGCQHRLDFLGGYTLATQACCTNEHHLQINGQHGHHISIEHGTIHASIREPLSSLGTLTNYQPMLHQSVSSPISTIISISHPQDWSPMKNSRWLSQPPINLNSQQTLGCTSF